MPPTVAAYQPTRDQIMRQQQRQQQLLDQARDESYQARNESRRQAQEEFDRTEGEVSRRMFAGAGISPQQLLDRVYDESRRQILELSGRNERDASRQMFDRASIDPQQLADRYAYYCEVAVRERQNPGGELSLSICHECPIPIHVQNHSIQIRPTGRTPHLVCRLATPTAARILKALDRLLHNRTKDLIATSLVVDVSVHKPCTDRPTPLQQGVTLPSIIFHPLFPCLYILLLLSVDTV